MTDCPASREAALDRLARFVPLAGWRYATERNLVAEPGAPDTVSRLSPYLRYRMLTEHEVVAAVLERHDLAACEKYVQEVLWRTYWKGWLEMRPFVWTRFLRERDEQKSAFPDARAVVAAESGTTGIAGFDDWARELVATGYLHNHVRMWFASIWIFTLRLPWTLGADFFLRHLRDADPASNTLSWRWVAGLQTVGKHYLATADNIARCTDGRYMPVGLVTEAPPLTELPLEPLQKLVDPERADASQRSLLLVAPEDLHPESLFARGPTIAAAMVATDRDACWGDRARAFVREAGDDAARRVAVHFDCPASRSDMLDVESVTNAARAAGVDQVLTALAPVGPTASALATMAPALAHEGIRLVRVQRPWDAHFWPHAGKGYFPFRARIPALLREQGLARGAPAGNVA